MGFLDFLYDFDDFILEKKPRKRRVKEVNGVKMKECPKCLETKPLDAYYKRRPSPLSARASSPQGYCKACYKKVVR